MAMIEAAQVLIHSYDCGEPTPPPGGAGRHKWHPWLKVCCIFCGRAPFLQMSRLCRISASQPDLKHRLQLLDSLSFKENSDLIGMTLILSKWPTPIE